MKRFYITLFLVLPSLIYGQQDNFLSINIQSQLNTYFESSIDLKYIILDYSNDTVWVEDHLGIIVSSEQSFSSILGKGTYVSGNETNFDEIDWRFVNKFLIFKTNPILSLIGEFKLNSVPYAFHSLHLDSIPLMIQLNDVSGIPSSNEVLKYDPSGYYFAQDLTHDSSVFTYYNGTSNFADTALYGISNISWVDTVNYGFESDTSNVTLLVNSSTYSDTSNYSDSSGFAYYTSNAWQINGNNGVESELGSNNSVDFGFMTNSYIRLNLSNTSVSNVLTPVSGFNFQTTSGMLHKMNTSAGTPLNSFASASMYFNGEKSAFSGGTTNLNLDTLLGNYSFCWGENVGTNGPNSTVFGKNSSGDSALFGGSTMYESISSFAFGNNCHVAHMSVAIGYNASANYYRNVAIGKNVTATNQSSTVAIGDNVFCSGATSWGMGQNIEATGHFSTALGTNASTDFKNGSFVYGDNSTTDTVKNTANQQFMVRAAGGVIIYSSSNLLNGVSLASGGGSWNMISDMNKKHSITKINSDLGESWYEDIQVYKWKYKNQNQEHIGPMAQDMFKVFKVGESEKYINQLDIDGAVFYGSKVLSEKLKKKLVKSNEISNLESEIELEKVKLDELEKRILELYEEMDH
ncbi:MAG: tail fiber domain-containing protein [Crocinitomicaceae bacterium]